MKLSCRSRNFRPSKYEKICWHASLLIFDELKRRLNLKSLMGDGALHHSRGLSKPLNRILNRLSDIRNFMANLEAGMDAAGTTQWGKQA